MCFSSSQCSCSFCQSQSSQELQMQHKSLQFIWQLVQVPAFIILFQWHFQKVTIVLYSLYIWGKKKSSFLEIKLLPGNILLSIEMLSSSKVNILIAPITFKVTNIRQQASSSRQMLPTHLLWWTDRGNGSALLTSSLVKILKLLLPQSDLDVFHHWSILKSYYCGFIVS